MIASIIKRFRFCAAHQLPNHDGLCRQLHGHEYKVDVEVTGDVQPWGTGRPDEGMVVDFNRLKAVWAELEPALDHQFLNSSLDVPVTTAEMIAGWLLDRFQRQVHQVSAVTVWETDTSRATVRS